jgi:hypothetical protein
MPTTLTGLLLFVALLLPGFTFLGIFTFDRPRRRMTVLQETGTVAVVSIAIELVVLAGLLGIRQAVPSLRRGLDGFVSDPSTYFQAHYEQVLVWSVGLLATACALAAVAGLVARRIPVHASVMSSWWTLFDRWNPKAVRYIQCELDDGSFVSGVLGDWNTEGDDLADRDLILKPPILYRAAKGAEYKPHPVGAACVSARRIVAMFIAYDNPALDATLSSPSVGAEAAPSPEVAPTDDALDPRTEVSGSSLGDDQARHAPI